MNDSVQLVNLISKLEGIVEDIDSVSADFDGVVKVMSECLLLDKKIVMDDKVLTYRKDLEGIHKEIVSGVIPRINNYL